MKKVLFLFILNLLSLLAVAQSDIRLNNYWVNSQYINPATVYDKYQAVFSMAARKQWAGFPGAPTTFFASATTYLENFHTQLGAIAVQDQIGYTSTTNVDLTYAYAILFQQDWQLHFGLGGNVQCLSYDMSKMNLVDNNDKAAYDKLKSGTTLNADLGVEVTNKSFKIGASSQNIFSLFSKINNQQSNTNFLYGRYREYSNDIINLGAGICGIQYSNIYQAEFNATTYFKIPNRSGLNDQPDQFDLGLFYRTGSEAGLIFGFDISDAIHISYSYDYHFGGIRLSSYGTNELMITYNILREPVCHNCWY
ncbi:MAG: PorP/SprF family type IX secretion system membrane protein [Bacteroidota bacterium]|nr:PorP/SprF family type IX secretion system membrane protein [Bacteroidota bacterium]